MAAVLRIAKSSKSKTHIMYGANLSYRQLERYLEFLLDRGLLKVSGEKHSKARHLFVTTDRGLAFLKAYSMLKEIIKEKRRS